MTVLLAACAPVTRPTIKIGLAAPFEGRYRDVGYEVIYAVRLAVRDANAAGGVAGYGVELMALDDSGDAETAARQARKLATDPQVVGVLGDWLEQTTLAAAPVYAEAGVPYLATATGDLPEPAYRLWYTAATYAASAHPGEQACPLPCDSLEELAWAQNAWSVQPGGASLLGPALWGQAQFPQLAGQAGLAAAFVAPGPRPVDSLDPGFIGRYRAISNGVEPANAAVLAYDAARLLFQAIADSVAQTGSPTREGVQAALQKISLLGLGGDYAFDAERDLTEPHAWRYRWVSGSPILDP